MFRLIYMLGFSLGSWLFSEHANEFKTAPQVPEEYHYNAAVCAHALNQFTTRFLKKPANNPGEKPGQVEKVPFSSKAERLNRQPIPPSIKILTPDCLKAQNGKNDMASGKRMKPATVSIAKEPGGWIQPCRIGPWQKQVVFGGGRRFNFNGMDQ